MPTSDKSLKKLAETAQKGAKRDAPPAGRETGNPEKRIGPSR
jgi:hypothetical protein